MPRTAAGKHIGGTGEVGKAAKLFPGFPRRGTVFPGCVTVFPRSETMFPRSNFLKVRSQNTEVFPSCEKSIFPRSKRFIPGSRSVFQDSPLTSPDVYPSSPCIYPPSTLVRAFGPFELDQTILLRSPRRLPQFPNVLSEISQGSRAFSRSRFPPWTSQDVSPRTLGISKLQWHFQDSSMGCSNNSNCGLR